DLHGVERAGSNIQANIKLAVRQATRWQIVEHESRSPFYRVPTRPLVRFRACANGVSRTVEYIAPEELALAVLHLVEDQFGLVEASRGATTSPTTPVVLADAAWRT